MLDERRRQKVATRYEVRLIALSPIHVGSGAEKLMPAAGDVVADGNGRLVVVDLEKVAPPWLTEREFEDLIRGRRELRDILRGMERRRLRKMAAYILPEPEGRVKEIAQQAKTRTLRPYIPGSSVKGAIRTALARAIYRGESIQAEVNYVEDGERYVEKVADDLLDAEIFRPAQDEATHDVMRALQIGDSGPARGLGLCQVAVYTARSGGLEPKGHFRLHVETIPANMELVASARLDQYLLSSAEARVVLQLDTRRAYLENFVAHVNDFAEAVIDHEIGFFGRYSAPDVLDFYRGLKETLEQVRGPGRTCLLFLGWGPGWTAKTIGTALDSGTVNRVRNRFDRMGRRGFPVFPKSRRLVEKDGAPSVPLGWLAAVFQDAA
jgi:CRISPR-associated protein Csm5